MQCQLTNTFATSFSSVKFGKSLIKFAIILVLLINL